MNNSDMPAYPHVDADGHAGLLGDGLSKREYFAGLAMQGILACHEECKYQDVAVASARFADALLSEMEKTK